MEKSKQLMGQQQFDEKLMQNEELAEETSQLKSRCCDIWKQLTEEQARNAK